MPLDPDDEVESLRRAIDLVLQDAAVAQTRIADSAGCGWEEVPDHCAVLLARLRAKLLEAEVRADEALERRRT